jgi:hypothetical protein
VNYETNSQTDLRNIFTFEVNSNKLLTKNNYMNKFSLIGIFLISVFSLISCNQISKTANKSKIVKSESLSSGDNNFELFKANFKSIALDKLKELGEEFNNHYLAKDDTTLEVSQAYKEMYLKNLNTEYTYYGFKTELTNKSVILTFLNHYGAVNAKDGEVIDTSFFVSLVFSDSGKFQSSFRSFGSDLSGAPPTYNMTSTFDHENDRLIVTNYEYSIAKSPSEVKPMPGSDSIYLADLTTTKYYLNYATNKVVPINRIRSKAKVVFCFRNPLPVYLRPIE